jgi:hypothetical protein
LAHLQERRPQIFICQSQIGGHTCAVSNQTALELETSNETLAIFTACGDGDAFNEWLHLLSGNRTVEVRQPWLLHVCQPVEQRVPGAGHAVSAGRHAVSTGRHAVPTSGRAMSGARHASLRPGVLPESLPISAGRACPSG